MYYVCYCTFVYWIFSQHNNDAVRRIRKLSLPLNMNLSDVQLMFPAEDIMALTSSLITGEEVN